jgi:hypothetical protein
VSFVTVEPGVTDDVWKAALVRAGNPVTVNVIGVETGTLLSGAKLKEKVACWPALTVSLAAAVVMEKSGGTTVTPVTSEAVSFAVFASPPPETTAVFVTDVGAVPETFTVTVMAG